jgi:hypothetical protein
MKIYIFDIDLSIMVMALYCRKNRFQVFEKFQILKFTEKSTIVSPPDHPSAILTYFVLPQIFGVHDTPGCNRKRFSPLSCSCSQPLYCLHVIAYGTFRWRSRTENQYMLISISILRWRQLSSLCTLTLLSAALNQFLAPAPKPLLLTLTLDVRATDSSDTSN